MKYTIQLEINPNADDIQFLNDGIIHEHKLKKDMKPLDFFAYFVRDEQGQIVGGCAGDNMYGGLYVGQLWVKKELRGQGYGRKLMLLAEELAIKSQCRFVAVNTFEWEALGFYKKLGFYVEFKRSGFDKDSIFYFLRKNLVDKNPNDINLNDVKLVPAALNDYPVIQNMGRFYVYDMSQYMGNDEGWECPEDGLYECIDFKKYWETDDAYPFLVRYKNELAGFVIIDKKGSEPSIDFNVAQFFILRKFKNKGIGKHVAYQCFDRFKGKWEVMVIPGNDGAYQFWRSIISEYSNNQCKEYQRNVKHLSNSVKDIFCFNSRHDGNI